MRQRRVTKGIRIGLAPRLAGGWLAFDSDAARRRLVPIPPDWHTLDEKELRKLLGSAETMAAKRKRLIE